MAPFCLEAFVFLERLEPTPDPVERIRVLNSSLPSRSTAPSSCSTFIFSVPFVCFLIYKKV